MILRSLTLLDSFYKRLRLRKYKVNISPFAVFDCRCTFGKNVFIDRFCILHDSRIDDYSYIGFRSHTVNCSVGKFCSISSGVHIGMGLHPLDRVSTSPVFYNSNCTGAQFVEDGSVIKSIPTTVGNDVWIGTNALIIPGVVIGDGAVIAAGSVVTKDVSPYAIVGGVPAQIIRYRFSQDIIRELLEIGWWNWEEEELKRYSIHFNNAESFISVIKERK